MLFEGISCFGGILLEFLDSVAVNVAQNQINYLFLYIILYL